MIALPAEVEIIEAVEVVGMWLTPDREGGVRCSDDESFCYSAFQDISDAGTVYAPRNMMCSVSWFGARVSVVVSAHDLGVLEHDSCGRGGVAALVDA